MGGRNWGEEKEEEKEKEACWAQEETVKPEEELVEIVQEDP